MNSTRTLALVVVLASGYQTALATPQIPEKLVYGEYKFWIVEHPMSGLWYHGEGDPPAGMMLPPELDFVSTANWSGYRATWEIRESKLYLRRITGRRDGKKVRNEQIVEGKRFPVLAQWFTGKIHLTVGDQDPDSGEYEAVIVLKIDRGNVTSMTFSPSLRLPHTWNGL